MNKINQYLELKEKHQQEFNKFPMGFAFSYEQFKEGMEKLGLTMNDTDKVFGIFGGGFVRKSDEKAFNEMNKRHRQEEKEAIKNDLTGEGYIKDMFEYELSNHEYGYTFDIEETLNAVGITIDEINNSENLKHGLELALSRYEENEEEEDEDL